MHEDKPSQDLPSSQGDAKRLGFKHFYTGRPCKRGHVKPRFTSSGQCISCAQELSLKWYEENSDHVCKRIKKSRADNPDLNREKRRERYYRNIEQEREERRSWYRKYRKRILEKQNNRRNSDPEKHRDSNRKWRESNREKAAECVRKWQKLNPEKTREYSANRRSSKIERTPEWSNRDDILSVYEEAFSISKSAGIKYHVDHIIPLNGDGVCGLHVPWNLEILEARANSSKGATYDPARTSATMTPYMKMSR